jgi:hypothetical protein
MGIRHKRMSVCRGLGSLVDSCHQCIFQICKESTQSLVGRFASLSHLVD